MLRLHRLALLILPALATTAMAQASPKGSAALFPYSATTVAPARQQGSVAAGGLAWTCTGSRCTTSGPAAPSVAACTALARSVGAIRRFGRDRSTQLDAAQITECNAGASPTRAVPSTAAATGTNPAAGGALQTQPLRNKAGVSFTPPPPTDSATRAKIVILRARGATVPAAAFGASIWITPQRPFIDANTNLQVHSYGTSAPLYESTTEFPFGSLTAVRSPESGGYPLALNVAAGPSHYLLFQCIVSGPANYGYRTLSLMYRSTPSLNGRVNFVIEPSLDAGRHVLLWGIGLESQRWTFGGCEITPFSP